MTTPEASFSNRQIRRVALASGIGTTLEFYDFYLYGALSATVFGQLFFPNDNPAVGTLLALATFGVGFVARPLGGVIAGHFGDRVGRKAVLIGTLALMGVSTIGIGLLPTYETAGVLAPILLVILRVIQGLAHGGEWGGAVIMTVEHAPSARRGFYGSWPQMGIYAGIVISNLVLAGFMLLPDEQFLAWGWRLPFILGAVLVVLGIYLRKVITESPEFIQTKEAGQQPRIPVMEALRTSSRGILVTFGAKAAETCSFYLITVFALSYVTSETDLGEDVALNGVLVASLVALLTVGVFGAMADRFGRRPLYIFGAAFMVVFSFPFLWMAGSGSAAALWAALIIGLAVGHSAMYGAQSAYFSELFEPRVRYSGASLGYQVGAALIGGFTPLIAGSLMLYADGESWPVGIYVMAMSMVTVLAVGIWGQVRTSQTTSVADGAATAPTVATRQAL